MIENKVDVLFENWYETSAMPYDYTIKLATKLGFKAGFEANNFLTDRKRLVVCAALKSVNGLILGPRHYDETMVKQWHKLRWNMEDDDIEHGFIDQYGVFMDRTEALQVATEAGQLNRYREKSNPKDILFSGDLY